MTSRYSCATKDQGNRSPVHVFLSARARMGNGQSATTAIDPTTITTATTSTDTTTIDHNPFSSRLAKPPTKRNSLLRIASSKNSPTSSTRSDARKNNNIDSSPQSQNKRLSTLSFHSADYYPSDQVAGENSFVDEHKEPEEASETSPQTDETMSAINGVDKKTSLRTLLSDNNSSTSSSNIDVNAAIALLQQLQKNASPEELVALHRALLPQKRAEQPAVEEVPVSPYSRRGSVNIPGRATRSNSPLKKKESLKKESSKKESRDLVNTTKKQRPLSEQTLTTSSWTPFKRSVKHQSIDLGAAKTENALPRPNTPADLDVSEIGPYKLGTLRVMNGAVSPEPSLYSERDTSLPDLRKPNADYIPADSNKQAQLAVAVHDKISKTAADRKSQATSGLANHVSTPIPGLEGYEDSEEDEDFVPEPAPASIATKSAPASDTVAESRPLNMSVGSFVSRLSTIHDEGSPVDEVEDSQHALKKLTGRATLDTPPTSSGTDSVYSTAESLRIPVRPAMNHKPDSGYGSEQPPCARDATLVSYSSDDDQVDSARKDVTSQSNLQTPPRPCRTDVQPGSNRQSPVTALPKMRSAQSSNLINQSSRPSMSPAVRPPINKHMSMPVLQRNPPSADGVVFSAPVSPLNGNSPENQNKQPRKRLQKTAPAQRQTSAGNDTFQPSSSVESLPSVPDDLNVNFSRRIYRSPGSFHPEHAYAASAKPTEEMALESPVIPKTPERKSVGGIFAPKSKDSSSAKKTHTEGESTSLMSKFRLRGRSRSKSMSRPEISIPRQDEMPTVADTVPQYAEIIKAKEAEIENHKRESSKPRQAEEVRPSLADRGRTSSIPRYYAKPEAEREVERVQSPRVGMDEETARQLARRKSRDYVSAADREARRQRSQSRPREKTDERRSRSKTVGSESVDAKRSASAHASRIPRAEQEQQKPAMPVRVQETSRPRSKSVSAPTERLVERVQPPMPKLPMDDGVVSPLESPTHEAAHPGWPGWEKQASLWKEYRRSATEPMIAQQVTLTNPPSVVVSRYITPVDLSASVGASPKANDARPRTAHIARTQQVNNDPRPAKPDIPRTYSAPAEHFDPRPAKQDVPRTDSAVSTASYHTAQSTALKIMSPNVRSAVVDRESTYRPYRASDSVSVAKLTSSPPESSPRDSRPRTLNAPVVSTSSSVYSSREGSPAPDAVVDRYGGGLEYGWQRGTGFNGSAGTRTKMSEKAHRKSRGLSEFLGVDLSDVPVFIVNASQRTQTE